jgi:hypothetical protein
MLSKWALGMLCAVPALIVGCGGSGDPSSTGSIPAKIHAELLEDARQRAAEQGDRHPYDIEAVRTTTEKALSVLSLGSRHPRCESTPTCANWPSYAVAMRGNFSCEDCSGPAGATSEAFNVMMYITPARRPAPMHYPQPDALGEVYPELMEAGHPVPLTEYRLPIGGS